MGALPRRCLRKRRPRPLNAEHTAMPCGPGCAASLPVQLAPPELLPETVMHVWQWHRHACCNAPRNRTCCTACQPARTHTQIIYIYIYIYTV